VVDEHVLAPVIRRDEPVALVVAEPLHGSGCHLYTSLDCITNVQRKAQAETGTRSHSPAVADDTSSRRTHPISTERRRRNGDTERENRPVSRRNRVFGTHTFNVYRVSWQLQPAEAYAAYLPPAQALLPATGTSGTLRLSRRGDIFTAYYLNGMNWVPLVSGVGPTDDASLTLAVFNISAASPFAGLPVTVTFDNFHVFADHIVCP
jgi:hypothetical protein